MPVYRNQKRAALANTCIWQTHLKVVWEEAKPLCNGFKKIFDNHIPTLCRMGKGFFYFLRQGKAVPSTHY